ncbi:YqjF family protein [Gemmatimonas sp.]|uniref:YqjF family protein n=1 Tax=Gemmatimonas sp. TaxID=1962908 RepID=UPI00398367A2
MLNFEIPPAVLEPLVPKHTVLDLFEGRAVASIVGFRFLNTRVLGIPVPFHRDFDEVNLRFYVKRPMPDGSARRGVVFVRELVPRAAIAYTARLCYNEPYTALPMHSRVPPSLMPSPGRLMYGWFANAQHQQVSVTAVGEPQPLVRGSEPEFIAEHYWGYTAQRNGGTVEYQVAHPSWRVWQASAPSFDADVRGLYGAAFVAPLSLPPRSMFVAEGSPVTVYRPTRLR